MSEVVNGLGRPGKCSGAGEHGGEEGRRFEGWGDGRGRGGDGTEQPVETERAVERVVNESTRAGRAEPMDESMVEGRNELGGDVLPSAYRSRAKPPVMVSPLLQSRPFRIQSSSAIHHSAAIISITTDIVTITVVLCSFIPSFLSCLPASAIAHG